MESTIIAALITGGLALIGVIITNFASSKKIEQSLVKAQAVTDTKTEELTREVRQHNNFATKIPVIEGQLKDAFRRIEMLEAYHRQK